MRQASCDGKLRWIINDMYVTWAKNVKEVQEKSARKNIQIQSIKPSYSSMERPNKCPPKNRQAQSDSKRGVINVSKPRMITPVEAERLQGFPDGYTEGVSNTQRYKMLGNGFTVPVIECLLSTLEVQYERSHQERERWLGMGLPIGRIPGL